MSSILGNSQLAFNNITESNVDILKLIKEISNNIVNNKEIILKANKKDILENKGFELDFNVISELLKKIKNQKSLYKTKLISDSKNTITEYDNLGVLETFFDGNTYVFIEIALKTLISHNSMIFISQNEYMNYTNSVIYNIIKDTLISKKLNQNIIQLVYEYNILKYCENNLIIKKAFVIGNTDLHNTIKRVSKLDTSYFPYSDCDIYIESINNIDKLKEFIAKNDNVLFKIYINKNLNLEMEDAEYVKDLSEVIEKIRFDSCGYCTMLCSNNKNTKLNFSEICKSKYILINKFMNFNKDTVDVNIDEFYCKKNIIL